MGGAEGPEGGRAFRTWGFSESHDLFPFVWFIDGFRWGFLVLTCCFSCGWALFCFLLRSETSVDRIPIDEVNADHAESDDDRGEGDDFPAEGNGVRRESCGVHAQTDRVRGQMTGIGLL